MISKHATSPAGERIDIVSDADWLARTGVSDKSLHQWMGGSKRFVIADLWRNGPVVDEKSGRATYLLFKRMQQTFGDDLGGTQSAFSGMSTDAMNAPAFELKTKGKRRYLIRLVSLPQTWFDKLMADEDDRDQQANEESIQRHLDEQRARDQAEAEAAEQRIGMAEPEPADRAGDDAFDAMIRDMELDAPTVYDVAPPLEIAMASQVAMSLLTAVVEIISAGSGAAVDEKVRTLQGDLTDAMGKLSARLEENDRMRRQLRQAGDEIVALRHERDGLRSRLRATEANLTAALKGDAVQAINGEIQKRVDAIMRVSPTTKGE